MAKCQNPALIILSAKQTPVIIPSPREWKMMATLNSHHIYHIRSQLVDNNPCISPRGQSRSNLSVKGGLRNWGVYSEIIGDDGWRLNLGCRFISPTGYLRWLANTYLNNPPHLYHPTHQISMKSALPLSIQLGFVVETLFQDVKPIHNLVWTASQQ